MVARSYLTHCNVLYTLVKQRFDVRLVRQRFVASAFVDTFRLLFS